MICLITFCSVIRIRSNQKFLRSEYVFRKKNRFFTQFLLAVRGISPHISTDEEGGGLIPPSPPSFPSKGSLGVGWHDPRQCVGQLWGMNKVHPAYVVEL